MMRIARTHVVRYTQQINKISIMMTILFVINSVEAEYGHGSRLRNKMPIKNKKTEKKNDDDRNGITDHDYKNVCN